MSNATPLHPPISPVKITHDARVEGGMLINMGGVVALFKRGDTPQARRAYRIYLAEWRARDGQPLTNEQREQEAVLATLTRLGLRTTTRVLTR